MYERARTCVPTTLPYFRLAEVLPGDGDFKMDGHCNLEEMNGTLIFDTSRHFLLLNHGRKVKVAKPNPYKKTCKSWWLGKPFERPFEIFDLLITSGKTRSLSVPISQFGAPQGSKKRHTDRGRRGPSRYTLVLHIWITMETVENI